MRSSSKFKRRKRIKMSSKFTATTPRVETIKRLANTTKPRKHILSNTANQEWSSICGKWMDTASISISANGISLRTQKTANFSSTRESFEKSSWNIRAGRASIRMASQSTGLRLLGKSKFGSKSKKSHTFYSTTANTNQTNSHQGKLPRRWDSPKSFCGTWNSILWNATIAMGGLGRRSTKINSKGCVGSSAGFSSEYSWINPLKRGSVSDYNMAMPTWTANRIAPKCAKLICKDNVCKSRPSEKLLKMSVKIECYQTILFTNVLQLLNSVIIQFLILVVGTKLKHRKINTHIQKNLILEY